jgi:hypothetical protein
MTVTYIDGAQDKHLAPEALLISALINDGHYLPEAFSIRDEHFAAYLPVHEFCKKYQQDAGKAPDVGLVRAYSKSFPYMEHVSARWAAARVQDEWKSRVLRKAMSDSAVIMRSGEHDIREVITTLKEAVDRTSPTNSLYTDASDYTEFLDSVEDAPIPVDLDPAGRLTTLTGGGVRPGNLWYVAARLGDGKTWKLVSMAVAAAEAGSTAWFYSTEMTTKEVMDRVHRIALRHAWKKPWAGISMEERVRLFDEWQERNGRIKVVDPRSGAIDVSMIAGNHEEGSVALVDYIGRMRTAKGTRSIEDWRMAATISNELKETALSHRIPIVCAAQINREGARGDGNGAHRAENISQSDAIGQDADVLLTSSRASTRLRFNSLTKSRHGAGGAKWHSLFDPDLGQFYDVNPSQAATIKEKDAESEAAHL